MVPRLTSASRCTGSVSPPELWQLRHFSYIFPCRNSSWASGLPQEVPSRTAAPVSSLCRAPRPEGALKALLRPSASLLGWQCLMELRADVFPRDASFCRTANCPSSSRTLPGKRTGNAWHLVRLGNVLSVTRLSRDKCCFKHGKRASPCRLPGVTNPAAHAFGGAMCSLPLRRGWEDARAMRMPGLTLAPAITQSPPASACTPRAWAGPPQRRKSLREGRAFQAAGGGEVQLPPRWAGPTSRAGRWAVVSAKHSAEELVALYSEM